MQKFVIQDLKLSTAGLVIDSKLTKPAKIQLLKFIKEASEEQLLNLWINGEIQSSKNINLQEISEEFYNNEMLLEISTSMLGKVGKAIGKGAKGYYNLAVKPFISGTGTTYKTLRPLIKGIENKKVIGTAAKYGLMSADFAVAGFIGSLTWKSFQNARNKAYRSCKILSGPTERSNCILLKKVEFTKKEIELLRNAKPKCATNKTPDKCNEYFENRISSKEFWLEQTEKKLLANKQEAEEKRQIEIEKEKMKKEQLQNKILMKARNRV